MKLTSLTIRMLGSGEEIPYELLMLADPSVEMIQKYINDSVIIELLDETRVIGVCVLRDIAEHTLEVMNLAVDPAMQGQGCGQRLLREAAEWARSNGYAILEVSTGNSSIGQLYLYQKVGFRIVGVEPDYFTKHYDEPIIENGLVCCDRILLKKKLV
ncbi:GNAT family N-acetyltransferase [Paenibacillus marinisediminis]